MLLVPRVDDFELESDSAAWVVAGWQRIPTTTGETGHGTRFRALWSATGIYVAFECEDDRRVTTGLPDGSDLWNEDVVEAFFCPDESRRLYLEYELSPAGSELLLLVPSCEDEFMGWSQWHFEAERRTRKAVRSTGIENWTAEFFMPFSLFRGLCKIPPQRGTVWRANFCRIDHDGGSPELYSWSPGIGKTFHDLPRFGQIEFG